MMRQIRPLEIILAAALILGGCAVGPNYTPPENTVSNFWNSRKEGDNFTSEEAATEWWKLLNDPLLTRYIEAAAQHNKDVLAAEANILQARALKQVAASSLFPQLASNINGTKTYFSKNGPLFAGPSLTQGVSTSTGLPFTVQTPQIQPLYNALLDATWEIDLFGKTRRSVEAAQANIGTAIETRNDLLLSIFAEIARTYIDIRSSQQLAVLVEKNIEIVEKNLILAKEQYACGLVNKLAVENIEADLAADKANLPNLIAQVYQGVYTISILTGNLPEVLAEELLPLQPLPQLPQTVAMGMRSDLLRRRPDVRRSERQLASATANIGVAVASFFPSVVLSADAGLQSLKLGNLFQLASRTWDYGGNVNIPIFEGGQLVGTLHASRAAASIAAYTYQQTVLNAVQEAESALVKFSKSRETAHSLKESAFWKHRTFHLTQERYEKGLIALTDVLSEERAWNASEQTALTSESAALTNVIALYKALGGGWEIKNDPN